MKKPTLLSVITVLIFLAWGPFTLAHAQVTTNEEKPTFYRLVPGTYVNGWPRFTITYPKNWVERASYFTAGEIFEVAAPGPDRSSTLGVVVAFFPLALDKWGEEWAAAFRKMGATEVTVVSDKPSQLRDGTPAREVELKALFNGTLWNMMGLAAKKGDMIVNMGIGSLRSKLGDDLTPILSSLEFQPGKDEPLKVPADIQEFLDKFCSDMVSHDVAKVVAHYSDKYLNSGVRKGEMERLYKQIIGPVTSFEVGITDFVPAGDMAYLAGFNSSYWGKGMLFETSIIKENGEWKWYGNQRDVVP